MNIKGLQVLVGQGFPVLRNLVLFRDLSEIPASHMDAYGNQPRWAMRGFDDRGSVNDSPYGLREAKTVHSFPRGKLKKVFGQVNKALDKGGVPKDSRTYLVCEVFTDNDVDFSGFAFRDQENTYIDIKKGNRPSRKDWDPDEAFVVPTLGRPLFSAIPADSEYRDSAVRIVRDMIRLPENTNVDFTGLKDRYFFYHDMGIVK